MRPSILDPLFASIRTLPGVGPKIAPLIAKAVGADGDEPTIRDLLFHMPSGIVDRSVRPPLYALPQSGVVTIEGTVERHDPAPPGTRKPWRVTIGDGGAGVQLVYFNPRADWIKALLPVGERRVVSGTVEWFDMRAQIAHPDYVLPPERAAEMPTLEPVYPLTAGLSAKILRRAVGAAAERTLALPEWISADLLASRGWPSFVAALRSVHHPVTAEDSLPGGSAWQRLAFDEMLASQIALALVRANLRRGRGTAWRAAGKLQGQIAAALPFRLTPSQATAVAEIDRDLAGENRMLRLLQGDVGSGKTVVALLAMATVAEAGGQAALMAPTELLARQHLATIAPLAAAAGLQTVLLTGKDKAPARRRAAEALASGEAHIAVGTHALFQPDVAFHRLGLAVVDEQHRFGVHQRLALSGKGNAPDVLVMTATPIPRTLVLSWFGDVDVSRLTEKPAGRQPIDTRIIPLDRLSGVVDGIHRAVDAGEKAYWVCPLVEESELSDAVAAENRFVSLQRVFGPQVGLIHGRKSAAEKDQVMAQFRSGEIAVLVATTVIEVGVDVPDATIMVIEEAERFGLAQLHQLRGRIGRSERKSTCLLLYGSPLGETARARLAVMRDTEDGFRIAEEDLRLRGQGDVLGTRQSGMPGFRIALPEVHGDLLAIARDEAKLALAGDPDFSGSRAEALRVLLYLFGRDDAVRMMRAG